MVSKKKHMYYVPISFGLQLGLQFWMQQLQLGETNIIMCTPRQKSDCVSALFCELNDCISSWNKYIKTEISWLSHPTIKSLILSKYLGWQVLCSGRGFHFNHEMDQFSFPLKVFTADKSVWSAKSKLQAGCYIAAHSWKVSAVFKAQSFLI